MIGLVGSTGLIGTALQRTVEFDADSKVVARFFPQLTIAPGANGQPYNITDNGKYTVTEQQVFDAMEQYFQ